VTLKGAGVPAVAFTVGDENVQVVFVGKLVGQTSVTVPLKTLSGTTSRLNVPAAPAWTETEESWALANPIWKSSPVPVRTVEAESEVFESVTVSVSERNPVVVGVNAMPSVQLEFASSVAVQLLV
jgi:hypothetical protein